MADPQSYRPPADHIPNRPGVYRFRDAHGTVIYVGKASNLRSRLSSYFADPRSLHPRTYSMVHAASSVDWLVVASELEALTLEYQWIKEFDPRFNVRFRDDKSYPFVSVSVADEFPRVAVVREAKRKGSRYFGPYAHAWAIRETLDELLRAFPMRSCRDGVFLRAQRSGRPCLLADIGKCAAPCVGRVSPAEHRAIVDQFCTFLAGQGEPFIRDLERQMGAAAEREEFEEAARLRDRAGALRRALERNAVVLPDDADADLIAVHNGDLESGVQVIRVRGGRIRGEHGFVLEKAEELPSSGYMSRVLQRVYGEGDGPPREILVSELPADMATWEDWLRGARGASASIRVPRRGDKLALMATAQANAAQTLQRHHSSRSVDLAARSRALQDLQDYLQLPAAPLRIECIDISTLQGSDTVASLVVFEDGLPKKSDYRTYIVKEAAADDPAAIGEVVARRFRAGGSATRYPPGLLLVDGAAAQANAAKDALAEAGLPDLPVVGLAKRLEEVWAPGSSDPVILPRTSEGLYLLQRIRDEAHRVAIGLHRKRRGRRSIASELDAVPGLGPARAKSLLRHFGSVKKIRAASPEELCAVPGIGPALAATIHRSLAGSSS